MAETYVFAAQGDQLILPARVHGLHCSTNASLGPCPIAEAIATSADGIELICLEQVHRGPGVVYRGVFSALDVEPKVKGREVPQLPWTPLPKRAVPAQRSLSTGMGSRDRVLPMATLLFSRRVCSLLATPGPQT